MQDKHTFTNSFFPDTNLALCLMITTTLTFKQQAFGIGAFEDNDDDIYSNDNMTRYDRVLGGEEPGDGKHGWTAPSRQQKGNALELTWAQSDVSQTTDSQQCNLMTCSFYGFNLFNYSINPNHLTYHFLL